MTHYPRSKLRQHRGNDQLSALVEPKRRFNSRRLPGCDTRLLGSLLADVEELSDVVTDLEGDGKGIPVLLRQYLNVGGQILAFNVDSSSQTFWMDWLWWTWAR